MTKDALGRCEAVLGHTFRDPLVLKCALTHSSVAESRAASNERLEFLGDAVLGVVVCDYLYTHYPTFLEGDLTKVKSAVVSRRTCAEVAAALGLPALLDIGKGMTNGARLPESLAAAALEAVIAALYLDGGLDVARAFVLRHMEEHIRRAVASEHQENYKSKLQQYAQKDLAASPMYELLDEKGPDHSKCFEVAVNLNGRRFRSAWGTSKKEAEQRAAYNALVALKLIDPQREPAPWEPLAADPTDAEPPPPVRKKKKPAASKRGAKGRT
jgi:ribonuclease-3